MQNTCNVHTFYNVHNVGVEWIRRWLRNSSLGAGAARFAYAFIAVLHLDHEYLSDRKFCDEKRKIILLNCINLPHAFTGVCLCCVICNFQLFDRLFKGIDWKEMTKAIGEDHR